MSRQVERTCSWIQEAVLILMDKKPYEAITVSDIVEKAGIARQTFYRNFIDKDEVIVKYVNKNFNAELFIEGEEITLIFDITHIIKERINLKKVLSVRNIENMFSYKLNQWLEQLTSHNEQIKFKYKMYYQITGILRVFLEWFKNDMPLPAVDLLKQLNHLTVNTPDVPNIKIKILE